MLLLLSFLFVYSISTAIADNSVCDKKEQIVFTAMLANMNKPTTPQEERLYYSVLNFTSSVYANQKENMRVKYWPPVYSRACEGDNEGWDKGRGSNLAHKEAWDQFYRHKVNCNDKLIVFEYDAFLGMPDAGDIAVELVKNMTVDLLYLGYCFKNAAFNPKVNGMPPYCLHAYAITREGARRLLEHVDVCSYFADVQLAVLSANKVVSWDFVKTTYDTAYTDRVMREKGIHISGPFKYDGIFLQVKLDDYTNKFVDGQIGHDSDYPKSIYVLLHGLWHRVSSMDVFYRIGLEGKFVHQLSAWQFSLYPLGGDITPEDEARIIEIYNSTSSPYYVPPSRTLRRR